MSATTTTAPIRELLLVKYLFRRGEKLVGEPGPYSSGMAISHFQDAVELMARIVAKSVGGSTPPKASFHDLWSIVRDSKQNLRKAELPLVSAMGDLNNARVAFKHFGNLPAPGEASKHAGHAATFLAQTCLLFFSLKFEAVSLVDLIENATVAGHLRAAESALRDGDCENAAKESATAVSYSSDTLRYLVPRLGPELSGALEHVPEIGRPLKGAAQNAEKHFNLLRDFAVATALKLSVAQQFRFRSVCPGVTRSQGGAFQFSWRPGKKAVSQEDAAFAVGYATEFAIAAQEVCAGLPVFDSGGAIATPHAASR